MGRINTELFMEQVSRLFNCDLHRFKKAGRLYGEDKELRDLIVFLLWERGSYTNREIGEVFSVGNTADSHTLVERNQNREGLIIKTNQMLLTVFRTRFASTVMMSYKSSFFSHFCLRLQSR